MFSTFTSISKQSANSKSESELSGGFDMCMDFVDLKILKSPEDFGGKTGLQRVSTFVANSKFKNKTLQINVLNPEAKILGKVSLGL